MITLVFVYAFFERSTGLTKIYSIAVLARDLINTGGLGGVLIGWRTVSDEL